MLPKIISANQSEFVKGRINIENELLAHELVTDIGKRGKPENVVIKLDMEKEYEGVLVLSDESVKEDRIF